MLGDSVIYFFGVTRWFFYVCNGVGLRHTVDVCCADSEGVAIFWFT